MVKDETIMRINKDVLLIFVDWQLNQKLFDKPRNMTYLRNRFFLRGLIEKLILVKNQEKKVSEVPWSPWVFFILKFKEKNDYNFVHYIIIHNNI
jgi:hypothetical protein